MPRTRYSWPLRVGVLRGLYQAVRTITLAQTYSATINYGRR